LSVPVAIEIAAMGTLAEAPLGHVPSDELAIEYA
jgi:hypothetical protein